MKFAIAALLLYAMLAVAMMGPLAANEVPNTPADDLRNHVSGLIEARNALAEGQFPVRVAPHQNQDTRYPIFQFYGNFPYTLGGAAYLLTNHNPYKIWKWEITAFLIGGAFFTYRCGRMLTKQQLPAIAGGVVFLTAPYVLTDLHGRFAFCEIASFMLLPVVFYYSWQCFMKRRLGPILAGGVSWSALLLSHNIGYFYAAVFFGLFILSWLAPNRQRIVRCLRVGAAFGLGLALTAWSVVPQQQLVPDLRDGLLVQVFNTNWLSPLGVLLAPGLTLPVNLPTIYIGEPEHFGLQVGWPILVGVGLSVYCLRGKLARSRGRRALMVRLLGLFALVMFMVWSPFDFWSYLPAIFSYVQFSYRLLMFVVLFGSLLTAYALALALEGRLKPIHLACIILGLGWTASPYLGPHRAGENPGIQSEIAEPNMGRGGATGCYLISGNRLAASTVVHPAMNWASAANGGLLDGMEFHNKGRLRALFPGSREGDALRLEGAVSPQVKDNLKLVITVDGVIVDRPELPPGPFALQIPLPEAAERDSIEVVVEGKPIITPPPLPHRTPFLTPSFQLEDLSLEPAVPRNDIPRLLTAQEVRGQIKFGHPTRLVVNTEDAVLVQLPVLYYPSMLRLEVDRKRVPVENLGCFVAVTLPPGEHVVSVRFAGVRWADNVSLAAWIGVGLATGGLLLRRVCTRRRRGEDQTGKAYVVTSLAVSGRKSRSLVHAGEVAQDS